MVLSFMFCTTTVFNAHRFFKCGVLAVAALFYFGVHMSFAWSALRGDHSSSGDSGGSSSAIKQGDKGSSMV